MDCDTPEAFSRAFSAAWSQRDPEALAALFAEDADFLTLTGLWAEGRKAITETLSAELAGVFRRARLVTGRIKVRALTPEIAVLAQRFVLSGLVREDGSDAGRVGAVLSATLARAPEGYRAVAAQFTAEV